MAQSANINMNNPIIRVLLVHSSPNLTIVPATLWKAKKLDGSAIADLPALAEAKIFFSNGKILLECSGGKFTLDSFALEATEPCGIMEIKKVPFGVGWWWEGTQDRTYEGRIEIFPNAKGNLDVVNVLTMEEYLRGVVPSEIGPTSPQEALRAQAVAARSEALLALMTGKYAGTHHDTGSDVESQAFTGTTKRTAGSDESVLATRGLALIFEGKPIPAYYASSCGGHTEDIRNVWHERVGEKSYWDTAVYDGEKTFDYDLSKEEYLRRWLEADPNVFCNPNKYNVPDWASKNFRWEREITADDLSKRIASSKKDIGRVIAIKPIKRGSSGRLIEVEFVGETGSLIAGPELEIRQVFDPPLKSAAFVVDTQGPQSRPDKFIIRGAGWGHGVGMCQTGAIAMAHSGKNFREILAHYYPTSRVESVY
ncbi:MAG TPA: SpoIID/LytB domain-containing protein [Candidatus Sumerlaeota bacterium]|nr:MAG: Amidase enhancer precursor [candidate division BRC1 bacterium ADurb.Bin183]HOE63534.1 SpoIID/LytB domain-containing protein [Candidatus Sumerlaeota bacterium]HRR30551.1 SpoIID/LytB domain-containing protein [Candidatus Sumerlaeia bacterium]HON51351.1 SpoIID/LytB domain-containing protein [Candidatus Sumerlaeota bacterium]HOR64596.1 SpoIID/LytB domain-containing protein [Candidatus Sumerlaeota bacterium]